MDSHYLAEQLERHSLITSLASLEKISQYIELLQRWNKVHNLIGDAATQHIIDRHIIDSLLAIPYLQKERIIDVGSGAGLPGIPLAIMLPDCSLTLLDSNGKKTRFLTQAVLELSLKNVTVIQERVENFHPDFLYDTVITRAFASIPDMLELTDHLCKATGKFVALKGDNLTELNELSEKYQCILQERLPFADKTIQRQIVVIKRREKDL